jgi:hypothetical protein
MRVNYIWAYVQKNHIEIRFTKFEPCIKPSKFRFETTDRRIYSLKIFLGLSFSTNHCSHGT